ncbi:MAG: hypothetical protein RLZ56_181 [Bacteroidota bacterium]|jgi:hypothetical protein
MKQKRNYTILAYAIVVYLLITAACYKQVLPIDPQLHMNDSTMSIQAFRKWHTMGMVEWIGQPVAIEGVVVANDEHDNWYKSICIQDNTGGIVIQMDGLSLYQNYPIGSLIKVHLQHLFLTDYRRMLQVVADVDTSTGSLTTMGIPKPLFSKFITIIKEDAPIHPLQVGYKNLGDSLQGRLIQINAVEMSALDTGSTYADARNKLGASKSIKFCTGGTIYLRTSGYADFAAAKTQSGNGILMGIYSVYNAEKQIMLRDTNDILLTGKRCTGAAWLQNLPQNNPKLPN